MRRALTVFIAVIVTVILALGIGAIPFPAVYPAAQARADNTVSETHQIAVLSNGFHAAIAVPSEVVLQLPNGPVAIEEVLGINIADFPVDHELVRHWLIGWGSHTAYTSLRELRYLTPAIAARALSFDRTVMHVQPLGEIDESRPGVFVFDVSAAQLATLVRAMADDFASSDPIAGVTQGFGDRFYAGHGRFSPLNSCNSWVGRQLRKAGIGTGLWTPLAQTLEFSLARAQVAQTR